jgi:predicted TIM-barrel fold metal-dependent hydrolase
MRIDDAHVHFASAPRLGELERCLSEGRVSRLAAVSLPDARGIHFNPEVLYAKLRLGRRCYGLGSFDHCARLHPDLFRSGEGGEASGQDAGEELDLAGQVDRLRELGFDGLKVFLGKPAFQRQVGLSLTDPPVERALARAAALGLPALIHVADPPVFWTAGPLAAAAGGPESAADLPPAVPGYEELQAQALAVLDRHPRLIVIFAHLLMMAHDLPRLAGILAAHPNAYLDLAPGLYFYGELARRAEEAREFLIRFRQRLLFGSDAFWFDPAFEGLPLSPAAENLRRGRRLLEFLVTEHEMDNPFPYTREAQPRLRGLGLGRSREGRRALREILRGNFRRLFPRTPAPVDPAACARYAEQTAARARRLAAERRARELDELASLLRGRPASQGGRAC